MLSELITQLDPEQSAASQLWQPDPNNEPQQLAYKLATEVDEMGFGGQAGGGKTDLGLGLAGTLFNRTLLIRRTFPQLKGIIERGNEIYPTSYVAGTKSYWRFGNRLVELGHLQYAKDWQNYQGQPRELFVVDEAAQFPEEPLRKIAAWNRSAAGRHTLTLYLFNPPTTPEGEWVIRYFAPWIDPDHPNPAESGEIRYFATINGEQVEVDSPEPFEHPDEGTVYPVKRTFIAASRHDNSYLGVDYERRLQGTPEPLKTMLMTGDMTVGQKEDPWQVIPTAWVLQAQERWETQAPPDLEIRAAGVDVARGGDDNTVVAPLRGVWFDELTVKPGIETPDGKSVADLTYEVLGDASTNVFVDVIGVGASAYDALLDNYHYNTQAINNSESAGKARDASGQYGFANVRSWSYWTLREALNPESGEEIALPPGRDIRLELCAPRYKVRNGKYVVEPKADIVKRLGYSPDKADAIVMAWFGAIQREVEWLVL